MGLPGEALLEQFERGLQYVERHPEEFTPEREAVLRVILHRSLGFGLAKSYMT